MDQDFERQYKQENLLAQLLSLFSFITISIMVIGLMGLISFIALTRTKEIGIRKTLGASVSSILTTLSKEFAYLILLGILVTIPVVLFFGNRWLDDFAYRTSIDPMIFIFTALIISITALSAVSFQALKTARMNPVQALRHE
ncbi:MAG: FtsX-like permease family protein [Bacteroidota bacterium]